MIRILLITLLCALFACNISDDAPMNEHEFIDLNAWMDEQIEDLSGTQLRKKTIWKGDVSGDSVYKPDWEKELSAFRGIPLTPSSWKTDFKLVQTLENGLETFILEPKGELNELRQAKIQKAGGVVKTIELRYNYSNMLKNSQRELRFIAGEGYRISGEQKTRFFPEENYIIVGEFEPTTEIE